MGRLLEFDDVRCSGGQRVQSFVLRTIFKIHVSCCGRDRTIRLEDNAEVLVDPTTL